MDKERQTVLVVDDEPEMLEVATLILEGEGYRVVTAANGLQALGMVELQMPDLIVLDLRMPVMDGRAFAKEFQDRYHQRPPLLVLTAYRDPHGSAEQMGATAALAKPFDLERLVAAVGRCLEPRERQLEA